MTPTAIATRSDRIQRTLEHLRHHTTDTTGQLVPFGPGQYTDPGLAQRERDLVFGQVPSIVAHASELPERGDFITLQMPRNRVIVARQRDGSVKCFVNVCRHRGALLEEQESGRCRLFSCGYHRWSYNIDGSLRAITREATFGEVDRSRHGLIELPAQERHGLIWMVDRAGAPIDVAAWLGPEVDEILAGYRLGMTELGGISTLNPADQAVDRPESVGRGTVFTRHRVVRPDGTDCDAEEPGEIIVSGPGVTPGYWRNEAAYAEAMRDSWFHSGDVGVKDADGFIRVADRLKDIIITGGYNVAPSEIEAVISELPAVLEVCVVSMADAKFGEAPAAVIYARDAVTAEQVTAHCRERLAGYKVPRRVIVQDRPLERMASGKIARRTIRDAHPALAAAAQPVG